MDYIIILLAILSGFGIDKIIKSIFNYSLRRKEFKFKSIHENRVEVLIKLDHKITKTIRAFKALLQPMSIAEEPPEEEKMKKAAEQARELVFYFEDNRIYLDQELENKINNINDEIYKIWLSYKYASKEKNKDYDKLFKLWEKIKEDVPEVSKEIREEFRKKIGIKSRICFRIKNFF